MPHLPPAPFQGFSSGELSPGAWDTGHGAWLGLGRQESFLECHPNGQAEGRGQGGRGGGPQARFPGLYPSYLKPLLLCILPYLRPASPLSCLLLVCPIRAGGLLLGVHTGLSCSNRHLYLVTEQLEPSSLPSCFKLHPEGSWWAPAQGRSRLPIRGQVPWAWGAESSHLFQRSPSISALHPSWSLRALRFCLCSVRSPLPPIRPLSLPK